MKLEISKKAFDNYVAKYDINNDLIKRKYGHTYDVVEMSKKICLSMGLSKEDTNVAIIIALLHDIGRFDQVSKYSTLNDHISFDHADYACEILKKDDFIREFVLDNRWDNIVLTAIKNHNKFEIEDNLSEKELLHSRIIRDADKLDIIRMRCSDDYKDFFDKNFAIDSWDTVSDNVYKSMINYNLVNNKDTKTGLDYVLLCIGFIYDINFVESMNIIKENRYLDTIEEYFVKIEDKTSRKKLKEIIGLSKDFLDNKVLEIV